VISGYPTRQAVLDHLAALEREKGAGNMNPARLQKIEEQEAIFRAELESLGEGDYEEPERTVREGPFGWVNAMGRPQVR
jgi:hypothetical protein